MNKVKAYIHLLKKTWPYLLQPRRIELLKNGFEAYRKTVYEYKEFIGNMDAETWKDEVVQSLKQELGARKAAMDEEEQAHEEMEAELRKEIADLTKKLAEAKAERASALAEAACLRQEIADALRTETTPADC